MGSPPVSADFWSTSTPVHRLNDNRYFASISPLPFCSSEKNLGFMTPTMHKRSITRYNNMQYTNPSVYHRRIVKWKTSHPIKLRFMDNSFRNSNNINSQNSRLESSPDTFSMSEMMGSLRDLQNNYVNSNVNHHSNSLNKCDEVNNNIDFWHSLCKSFGIIQINEKMLNDDNNNEVNRDINENSSNVDILMELKKRNCYDILSRVLSYISNEDIRNCKNVNKNWEKIVLGDRKAIKRLTAYFYRMKSQKENRSRSKCRPKRSRRSSVLSMMNTSAEASPISTISTSTTPKSGSSRQSPEIFNSFIEVAQNLKPGEQLRKCLACQYPALPKDNKYCCSRTECRYTFCGECLSPHRDNMRHTCTVIKFTPLPNLLFGSKQSKKNLRRLSWNRSH